MEDIQVWEVFKVKGENMEEKISNRIFLKQKLINELNELKEKINKSDTDKIRFRIETKHWYGYLEPFLAKNKSYISIYKNIVLLLVDQTINVVRKDINILTSEYNKKKDELK